MRMTADALDLAAARLEQIQREEEELRAKLREQVEEFGFTPPHAEKSKRIIGVLYQFTVSRGLTTGVPFSLGKTSASIGTLAFCARHISRAGSTRCRMSGLRGT